MSTTPSFTPEQLRTPSTTVGSTKQRPPVTAVRTWEEAPLSVAPSGFEGARSATQATAPTVPVDTVNCNVTVDRKPETVAGEPRSTAQIEAEPAKNDNAKSHSVWSTIWNGVCHPLRSLNNFLDGASWVLSPGGYYAKHYVLPHLREAATVAASACISNIAVALPFAGRAMGPAGIAATFALGTLLAGGVEFALQQRELATGKREALNVSKILRTAVEAGVVSVLGVTVFGSTVSPLKPALISALGLGIKSAQDWSGENRRLAKASK